MNVHLATEVEEAPLSIEGFGAEKVSNDCKNKAFDFLAYNSQIGDEWFFREPALGWWLVFCSILVVVFVA